MRLKFLGTGAALPTRERNVAGLALRLEEQTGWLLVDCGEGTQHRLLGSGLTLPALAAVLVTHLHGDHVYGLFGLIASRGLQGATAPLTVCGPVGIEALLRCVLEMSGNRPPFPLAVRELPAAGGEALAGPGWRVEAVPLVHRLPSFGYLVREDDRPGRLDAAALAAAGVAPGPLYGPLKRGETVTLADGRQVRGRDFLGPPRRGRAVLVAGDDERPDLLRERLAGLDLLVHEATFAGADAPPPGQRGGHSTAAEVARAAAAAGVPNLVLTHLSARYGGSAGAAGLAALAAEAREAYGGRLHLARDGDEVVLARDGSLHVTAAQT